MNQSSVRSSSQNRVAHIKKALEEAHQHAVDACGVSLQSMPEYFMCTWVAEHFANTFSNFRYQLEASVSNVLDTAPIVQESHPTIAGEQNMRVKGRFDLLIKLRRSGKPAHIIEFKKGTKIEALVSDINRIALLADAVEQGSRLETNYLVFITKRNQTLDMAGWQERLQLVVNKSVIGTKQLSNSMSCNVKGFWKAPETEGANPAMREQSFSVVIVELRSSY